MDARKKFPGAPRAGLTLMDGFRKASHETTTLASEFSNPPLEAVAMQRQTSAARFAPGRLRGERRTRLEGEFCARHLIS
ncbi:Hypothetical predicted protein [Cloeon dipterum]|uniref:Uncharacterized protein n=1 Tax=Cloeon dipterum TaxID=197152 RepID=A0A8S1D9N5_9INSE|nr:Hypothetical predicted protein [Cloeon dipterum]